VSEHRSDPNSAPDQEAGLEASVKGIGQGIAGKFKEMLGEFIEDPNLEEEGIVQQLDGQIRRAAAEHPSSPKEDPTHEG
jgi:uncharacterized protein YjbJ (UPF0337 family)